MSGQSVDTQQWQHPKYNSMLSRGQLNHSAIRTSSSGTHIDSVQSSNKSAQTTYSGDKGPCTNCSNVLICAAEFLTKIELNYDLTPITSTISSNTSNRYNKSIERSLKNKRRFARRKADNVSNIPISVANNKAIPVTSSSEALLIRHTNNQKLNSIQRKKADKPTVQNVSQIEEDIITPLDWMLSSKEKEKRKKMKEKFETDKFKNEKKAEQDNLVKNEANIESKLTESCEKGQEKHQKIMADNGSMTLDTTKIDSVATKKMQLESEKNDEHGAITSKTKDISKSDKKMTSDDKKNNNSNQKEVDKKVTKEDSSNKHAET
ncbi:Laminin subunit alpha [Dirofilaria immitis]